MIEEGGRYPYIEPRLIKRLRIYIIIMLIMLTIISFEVIIGTFSVVIALIGIISGLIIGTIISRIYSFSWDEIPKRYWAHRLDWRSYSLIL